MKRTFFGIMFGAVAAVAIAAPASAYTINGHYASLISCEFGFSAVRGESGYTGVYEVLGEYFSIYFGSNYCPP